jgi:2-keto-4-pentenoate hydratase/2-oxohepta-3-ene-1,7-dioic acid hydratase in catechol pathway
MDKIICVGKNYLEHAKELGDAVPEKPVLFLKPPSSLIEISPETLSKASVTLPQGRGQIHPECEIVARVRMTSHGPEIDAITLGLDLTLRDIQTQLKKNGHPWEISKVFAGSAIIGPWIPLSAFEDYLDHEFSFSVDGQVRQKARGREMRVLPADCLKAASESFPICNGDLLFTGTPVGVSPVSPGQNSELKWENHLSFQVHWK